MAKFKSFQLATDEQIRPQHAFVSFKTDPDEARARMVSEVLKGRGLDVTYIHGDSVCPHPFGSRQADRWIRRMLTEKVADARLLVSIASEASLQSRWVFQEFFQGTTAASLVLLLWFDGLDPSARFVPEPRAITRLLPSCPVYLVDCRGDVAARLADVGEILGSIAAARRTLVLRRLAFGLVLLGFFVGTFVLVLWRLPVVDDSLESLRRADQGKAYVLFSYYVIITLGVACMPSNYAIPHRLRSSRFITQIVPGIAMWKYVTLPLFLAAGLGFFPLSAGWWVVGVTSLTAGVTQLSRWLRDVLVRRAYLAAPETPAAGPPMVSRGPTR